MIICYTVPEICTAPDVCNFNFSFWVIFCSFTPLTARKIKVLKRWKKKARRYHHFTHVHQKLWSHDVRLLRYGAQWMNRDGYMNGQTEKVTYRGGCPTLKIWLKYVDFEHISYAKKFRFYIALHFIWLVKGEWGKGGNVSRQILLRNWKVICQWSLMPLKYQTITD